MSFHNRTLTFMTPKKRILEHVLKLDENILQAEEKCSTFLTLQLLPACMSAEKTVHVQACVLNCLLCLSVLCGSLFGFFVFIEEQCFTAYSSSRGLISLQSLDGLCKPGAFSCTIYSCETGLRSWCLHHENTVLYSHWRLQGLSSGRAHTQTHTELTAIHLPCRGR